MPELLDSETVTDSLRELPGWERDGRDGNALVRTVELPSFPAAITVVDEVARIAERADHHPDIDIRWRTLTFRCSTHSEGGITRLDLDLAAAISEVVQAARSD
jgi:4a-hydroxytetrahydrobiopterin dehydratase